MIPSKLKQIIRRVEALFTPAVATVNAISLDSWTRERHPAAIDLIKMDIEGAELEALAGAIPVLQRFRPEVLVQAYHLRNGARTLETCRSLLESTGYKCREVAEARGLLHATYPE